MAIPLPIPGMQSASVFCEQIPYQEMLPSLRRDTKADAQDAFLKKKRVVFISSMKKWIESHYDGEVSLKKMRRVTLNQDKRRIIS
jgi:hypothetical protein